MQYLLMRTAASIKVRPEVAVEVHSRSGTNTANSISAYFSDFHEMPLNGHELGMLAYPTVRFTAD